MDLQDRFARLEDTLLSQFREAGFVTHTGDRGENREDILSSFLQRHLPKKYGILKGEIITQDGTKSHSADIVIYDALNAPVLYRGRTAVAPIESVYGIIEVKSTLSKQEFLDASGKIESFKRLAPRQLNLIQTRDDVTLHRPPRPFGIVLAYQLGDNSLNSLRQNWQAESDRIHDVNFFTNLIVVLGAGLLHYEVVNFSIGTRDMLLDTDQLVDLVSTVHKRDANKEPVDETLLRIVEVAAKDRTFGRFFVFLLMMLSRLRLSVPDLGRYYDPELPMLIVRES